MTRTRCQIPCTEDIYRSARSSGPRSSATAAFVHAAETFESTLSNTNSVDGLLGDVDAVMQRLNRLRVDLECLDDGEAETLFGTPGVLRRQVNSIDSTLEICGDLRRSALEIAARGGANVGGFMEEACTMLQDLVFQCDVFAMRRDAAVARARAAIEVSAAQRSETACGLILQALEPTCCVDFTRITEICERLAAHPDEAGSAVVLLVRELHQAVDKDRKTVLKVLTLVNEMLHDPNVFAAYISVGKDPLSTLRILQRPPAAGATSMAPPAEENIRMLATEIERQLMAATNSSPSQARRRSISSDMGNSTQGQRTPFVQWEGDGKGVCRGRAGAEMLVRHCQRLGGNRALWAVRQELPLLFGDIFTTFGGFSSSLARLYEELDCLDTDDALTVEVLHQVAPLLLAASDVQSRSVAWQHWAMEVANVERGYDGHNTGSCADFLEEALAAAEGLERNRLRLTRFRRDAVENAKACIEANPTKL